MIEICRIEMENPLYLQEQDLRNRILLRPIGIPDHAWEMTDAISWHFVALEMDRVVGCVVLTPLDPLHQMVQLKQMAVETTHQSLGFGSMLVKRLFDFCKKEGIGQMVCHARQSAIPFYEKLGFEIYDEPFEEVGVPHRHMQIFM